MAHRFAGIERAAVEIAYDNGGIHRDRSEKQMRREFARWIEKQPQEILPAIDAWLAALSDDELMDVCAGCEIEREAAMKSAPPFTDKLLDDYFDEVC